MKPGSKTIAILMVAGSIALPLFANAASPTELMASMSESIRATINNLEAEVNTLYNQYLSQDNSTSTVTLQLGDKSVLVAVLQRALINQGYLTVPADGVFGTSTQIAVEAFQKANGYAITGYIRVPTQELSKAFSNDALPFATTTVGTTGSSVSGYQSLLIRGGYLKITQPTGYFGSLTQAAVEKFQAAQGLPQTGVVDQATFAAMNGK